MANTERGYAPVRGWMEKSLQVCSPRTLSTMASLTGVVLVGPLSVPRPGPKGRSPGHPAIHLWETDRVGLRGIRPTIG